MKTRKNTKRALVISALSLLLCVSMLVGTTFAWFTDNATASVTNVVSGTLDIELLDGGDESANSLEGKTLTFKKAAGAPADEKVLFEPGAKYSLTQVWLHNAGNLHAKYQVVITGIDGSSELAKVLDVYVAGVKAGTLADLVANGGIVKENTIAPKDYDTFGTIELEMQTTAGNEYQGLTMDGIAVTVQATQATKEFDSDDDQYDAGATYDKLVVAGNQTELNDAIANTPADEPVTVSLPAGSFTVPQIGSAQVPTPKDITFTGTKETIINMSNGVQTANCNLTFDGVTVDYADTSNYIGFQHSNKVVYKDCTITGQLTNYAPEASFINCKFENKNNAYCIWTYGGQNVTFTNCTFNTSGKAILVYTEGETHADINLSNCTFNDDNGVDTKKGAVEVGSSPYSTATTYNITINDCTVNGFAVNDEGISTGSTLWGNKNSMDKDHLNVVIDGVDVY